MLSDLHKPKQIIKRSLNELFKKHMFITFIYKIKLFIQINVNHYNTSVSKYMYNELNKSKLKCEEVDIIWIIYIDIRLLYRT